MNERYVVMLTDEGCRSLYAWVSSAKGAGIADRADLASASSQLVLRV